MITGYNTDIEFDGVVYHVQTEDKGTSTPVIMSLVYDRGTILASKRAPYDDLINGAVNEEAVAERLQRQHKLICAAVSSGRIEDLKQMSARNLKDAAGKRNGKKKVKNPPEVPEVELAAEVPESLAAITEPASVESAVAVPEIPAGVPEPKSVEFAAEVTESESVPAEPEKVESAPEVSAAPSVSPANEPPQERPLWPGPANQSTGHIPDTIPHFRLGEVLDPPTEELAPIAKPVLEPLPPPVKSAEPVTKRPVVDQTIIEEVHIVADEPIMVPVDAVEAVSDLAGTDRPESNKLNIDIIGGALFKGGEQKEVCVMVCRGNTRKVVARAEVMVKVLGSDFRPVIYHAVTDKNGLAMVDVRIPQFQSGRASMIARAISNGEEVEVRSAVAHG